MERPFGREERVPDERAQAIWRRAARLQADAAERLEERSRSLARRGAGSPPDGYSVIDVEAAAVEAGIAPEFVRLALAEDAMQVRRRGLSPRLDRFVTRMLGSGQRTVEASRVILAPPGEVFDAMTRLFPQHPYRLELRDSIGENLQEGAVLVFATPPYIGTTPNEFALDMAYADMKELHVMLRPVREGERTLATEVTVTSDLEHGRRLNLFMGGGIIGAGAAGGGATAGAVVGTVLGIGALPVAAGVVAGGGLFTVAYRALYRWGISRGAKALERLLAALDVNARTRGAFATPSPESDGGTK